MYNIFRQWKPSFKFTLEERFMQAFLIGKTGEEPRKNHHKVWSCLDTNPLESKVLGSQAERETPFCLAPYTRTVPVDFSGSCA